MPKSLQLVLIFLAGVLPGCAEETDCPWKTNSPIATIQRELYLEAPGPKTCAIAQLDYVGPGLEVREIRSTELRSDFLSGRSCRLSTDNGKTWSKPWPVPNELIKHKGVECWEGAGPVFYDPAAGVLVDIWLREVYTGPPSLWPRPIYHCFCYYRLSRDFGATWTEPKPLRYEPGEDFDAEDPYKPGHLFRNHAYFGNNILRHSNGTLIHCVASADDPSDPLCDRVPPNMGSVCFIAKWNPEAGDYEWHAGKCVKIRPDWSIRGLMEPELAELKGGRVLVIWRTSNYDHGVETVIPGRKFFSVSDDGGETLGAPQELKYDDGSSFYSPSSYQRMIRHSVTGKLYWIGNISATPPAGNEPRYPLVIAEVDESIPALKRNTVTVIDDREPGDAPRLALSNFSLMEDRQTHDLVLYLPRLDADPKEMGSHVYRYTITLK